ncbi:MAG TPA: MFS transporter [Acidimicrobiales bacterium]|nr:MFS transporter [Acidimicrobiales bacterium]
MRRASRREWIALAVLALPCAVVTMDLTVLNLAVPALSEDLHPSSAQLLWTVDIYGFFIAGSLITMGTLGDRIGRRRLLLAGAAAFGVASLLAALSTSPGMLIAARAVLGVAGATLAPSTLSLIRSLFPNDHDRTLAVGIWAASFSAGAGIGPLLGGALLEHFWWGSVFLPALGVMALLLALGPRLLPEFRNPAAGRIDLISAGLSLTAVLTVIYGLKQVAQDGFGWFPLLVVLGGTAIGAWFLRRQPTLADPLIDLQLFRAPVFRASLAVNTTSLFVDAGLLLLIAQYLQLVLGQSPLEAGLWTTPAAVGLIAGSLLAPVIVRRMPAGRTTAAGLALGAAGCALITQVTSTSGLAVLVAGSTVMSFGIAMAGTLSTDLIVGSAPEERAGAASALSETGTELGTALGIAILGSISTAVYRVQVALPADVAASTAHAARNTLGGAVSASERLPADLAAQLLDAATDAFTQAMRVTASLGAVIALAMAIVADTVHRRLRPDRPQPPDQTTDIVAQEAP